MEGFEESVALVTGASSGIGRASARRFAAEGSRVVVADVDEEGGTETVERIEGDGGEATFVRTDVADLDAVQAMVDTAREEYGGLDFAHNNAGILTSFEGLSEIDEADWDRLIAINLKGIWACLRAELPAMADDGGGAIVNTTSEAGLIGMGGLASYSASKHGVVGLTKTAALEYARRDVRVNAVAPGPTETNISEGIAVSENIESLPFDMTAMTDVPMDRTADPAEIAGVVAFLCSSDASYVTGTTIPVDGGQAAD